jgi:hypothetical protein
LKIFYFMQLFWYFVHHIKYMHSFYSNFFKRTKKASFLTLMILAIAIVMVVGIVVYILSLLQLFLGKAKDDLLRIGCEDDYYTLRANPVLFLLQECSQKAENAIHHFRLLFNLGLIHRVNQKEVVFYTITLPSYIIAK